MIAHSLGPYCPHKMSRVVPLLKPGMDPGFQAGGVGDKRIFFFSNTHPYSINKLSTKTNTQKSLFHNISRSTF